MPPDVQAPSHLIAQVQIQKACVRVCHCIAIPALLQQQLRSSTELACLASSALSLVMSWLGKALLAWAEARS